MIRLMKANGKATTLGESRYVVISIKLLESIRDDLIELLHENEWRRDSTERNAKYLEILETEIQDVEKVLKEK